MKSIKKILLVDDSPNDRELIITALQENNISNPVDTVDDGEEALDYLYKRGKFTDLPIGSPAVVLLDINMPKLSGLDVLEKIKSDDKLKSIPVVMLTSSREETDLVKSYRKGVNAYVVKPVDFEDFFKAVRELGIFWAIINETP